MAEQATGFVQEGVDRFNEARERIDDEIHRLQKDLRARRRKLERQFTSGRKNFEKRSRKHVRQLRTELRKNMLVQRAENLRAKAERRIEDTLESVLSTLGIASKQDLQRIDRKITKLNKKLREVELARKSDGQQPPTQF